MSLSFYQENISAAQLRVRELEKKINRNAVFRLLLMIIGGIGIWQLFGLNNILLVLGAIFAVIFIFAYLVFRQSKVERQLRDARVFYRVNENEIVVGDFGENVYEDGTRFENQKHPYSSDLDIFGRDSLFSYVNRCATQDGLEILKSWLSNPNLVDRQDILQRQAAVAELRDDPKHMQGFQTKMLFNLGSTINLKSYLKSYFTGPPFPFCGLIYRTYVPLVPWIFIVGLIVSFVVYPLVPYLVGLAVFHFLWALSQAGKVSRVSSRVDKIGASLMAYAEGVKLIEEKRYSAAFNRDLQQKIGFDRSDKKLSSIIHELGKLIDRLDARNNMLVGAVLNMFFLWDFKQIRSINNWKEEYEESVLRGFDMVAQYEALISLGLLAYNHSDWNFPKIKEQANSNILAVGLNHPLIKPIKAIRNDYDSNDHHIALITGSNMAGKSTFLRTIGINAILAYAGAVVHAERFELPVFQIVTYMRIKDSLNESTSTFKAELDRLKFILDEVKRSPASFFLIDEMLRGTNSMDKYLGSKAVIQTLIQSDGRGMLATHDLKLSEMASQYPRVLKNFHFDIQVQQGEMLFDYKLKEGACTIFNASMLLKGIGISIENE